MTAADELVIRTERLTLRPWRPGEGVVQRTLWVERDPRTPARRRIDADGNPALAEFEEALRSPRPSMAGLPGLLAVERRAEGDVIGGCGLIESDQGGAVEPELAFELLRRAWGRGYATEAANAVVDHARSSGVERLWATVWEWNTASRGVLTKLGFTETAREELALGTNLTTSLRLDGVDPAP